MSVIKKSALLVFFGLICTFGCPSVWAMDATQYIQDVQTENFSVLEDGLTKLEQAKEKDADGIYIFHQIVSRMGYDLALDPEPSLKLLDKWCDQKQSYLSFLVRGIFYTKFAWEDRGGKFADKVLPEAWQAFKDRLKLSQKDLDQAALLNLQSPEPYIALMLTFQGLSMPLQIEESFQKAIALDPEHYIAYHRMLIAKMEKWFGSNADMFAFAEKIYNEHKENPPFAELLLESHAEAASRYALKTGNKTDAYFKLPGNYEKTQEMLTEMFRVNPLSRMARTWAAKIDYLAYKNQSAFEHMKALGNDFDDSVWDRASYMKAKSWLERQHAKGAF